MGGSSLGLKRKGRARTTVSLKGLPRKCRSFFPDSGAHSLFNLHCFKTIGEGNKQERIFLPPAERYKWYSKDGKKFTKAFLEYLDDYVTFIHKYKSGIDYYANVDVIHNHELSWKSLKYLESNGLKPIPVIHHRAPVRVLDRHLDSGYKFIGIGGLGQNSTKHDYCKWADQMFDRICNNQARLPSVRTHGFAMTSYELMLRYPWWSVDSSSVYKCAGFGSIYVPHKRSNVFTFAEEPYVIGISHRSTAKKTAGRHFQTISEGERRIVTDWLRTIDMGIGKVKNGEMKVYGVASSYNARVVANLRFFEKFLESVPKWPWSFTRRPRKGFFTWEQLT